MSRRGIPETVKLVHEQEDLITDLRRRLDAAEARALTAEHEVEVVREERVKYGNGYYVENARAEMATGRAERAEAAEADLRATVDRVRATWRYIADTMATSSRDWSETATDAWLYGAIVGWGDGPDDPDEAWTAMAAVWWDADDVAQLKEIHATLAALDAQRPAEGGPEVTEWLIEPSADPCPQCGPGYRYGDEGCRHTPPPSPEGEGAADA